MGVMDDIGKNMNGVLGQIHPYVVFEKRLILEFQLFRRFPISRLILVEKIGNAHKAHFGIVDICIVEVSGKIDRKAFISNGKGSKQSEVWLLPGFPLLFVPVNN